MAYGLASAVHHLGNRSAAAIIAACAAAATTSCEAIGYVRDVVNTDVAGSGTLASERCRAFACGPRRAAGAGEKPAQVAATAAGRMIGQCVVLYVCVKVLCIC